MPISSATRREFGRAAERVEDRIEVVQGMAELVEAQVRLGPQLPVIVEGVLLEEAADRLAARQEIFVARMQSPAVCGENGRLVRRGHVPLRQHHRALAQGQAAAASTKSGSTRNPS